MRSRLPELALEDGALQEMNRAGLELFRVKSREELTQFNLFRDLSLVETQWESFITALRDHGRAVNYEVSFRGRGTRIRVASINASMERDLKTGKGVIRGTARDITRNRQLEQQTITDEMTTLYNRAFFDSCLAEKVKQARANRRAALSLLYLDIDDFKSYNDSYGHPEGDYVLRRVAQAIIAALRDEDIAARCGGEEFAVIVGCGAHAAARAAERVRASVEMSCSPLVDQRIRRSIMVSVGTATLGAQVATAQELVKVADGRMYDAKRRGKNRISVSEVSAPSTSAPAARR